ncbi:MAG TPA: site-2 protease family protein [Candidatus Dormibacteraeota bacterium]|nr:site-2 protease family protein [Candidatus Dormibacteraeota bacterium]
MNRPTPEDTAEIRPVEPAWTAEWPDPAMYEPAVRPPSRKSLLIACVLFLLTLCTCLAAGTQFAAAYAQDRAASFDEWEKAFTLFYKNPAGLLAGIPFALTLLTILMAHELGHFFACRHHRIRASYPFFIPFPSLIGTFGAFILIRSPIRTRRALFDVGASGPLVGFVFAIPALIYGVAHAKFVPGIADPEHAEVIFGAPLALHAIAGLLRPGAAVGKLLLDPVGRAAWVGLFATALNLLPAGQLDGGHILRSVSPRLHRLVSMGLPVLLIALGFLLHWTGWYIWGGILFGLRFLPVAPIYDPTTLDPARRLAATLALAVFLLSFMAAPILSQ